MYRLHALICKLYSKFFFVLMSVMKSFKVPNKVTLYGVPIVHKRKSANFYLGENITIVSRAKFTDLGVSKPCIFRMLGDDSSISIGSNSGLSGVTICARSSVTVGANCLIGADVTIFDTDFHAVMPAGRRFNTNPSDISVRPVVIKDNVFIGTKSIIMKGVTIGENSIIAAGSVVTRNVPSNAIAAGNPAKIIRMLTE